MYFLSLAPKCLPLIHILVVVAIQQLLIPSVLSLNMTNAYLQHKCYVNQGKYKPGSQYEKELTTILDNIPKSSNFSKGYEMEGISEGPIYVSVTHQCRGDSYGPKCRSCYSTALSGLRRRCPKYKGAIIWYDQCFLEISGIDSSRKIDYDNNFCMSNAKNETSGDPWTPLSLEYNILVDNLTTIAVEKKSSDPTVYYAAGERRLKTKKLYGMVQCTKDLSRKACQECILYNILHFQDCLKEKAGGRVLGKSCCFRYELYPFVNSKSEIK